MSEITVASTTDPQSAVDEAVSGVSSSGNEVTVVSTCSASHNSTDTLVRGL